MSQETLECIVEDVKTLTPQVQQQILLEHLLSKGIIGNIPSALYQEASHDFHIPVILNGEPVSETVLRERR